MLNHDLPSDISSNDSVATTNHEAKILPDERPFKGPKSYQESDRDNFYGRQAETNDLMTLIGKNNLVVLFGKTGTGKTSLVNASLFPTLRKHYFLPISIRIEYSDKITPVQSVRNQISNQLLYADRKGKSPEVYQFEIVDGKYETIASYLKRINYSGGILMPALFFDQFEELFRVGVKTMPPESKELVEELKALIGWNELENLYKVIISIREDYMAQLEELRHQIPNIILTRYRLKKFLGVQAIKAITGPAGNSINTDAAIEIIKVIGNPYDENFYEDINLEEKWNSFVIDPIILSIYCYELNEQRIDRKLPTIEREQIVNESNSGNIIRNYYNKATANNLKLREALEEELLSEDGKAKGNPQSLSELCSRYVLEEEMFKGLDKNFRIVKVESKNGVETVEIIHDLIAEQAFLSRQERRGREVIELQRRKSARKAFILIGVTVFLLISLSTIVLWYKTTKQTEFEKNRLIELEKKERAYKDRLQEQYIKKISEEKYKLNKLHNFALQKLDMQRQELETYKDYLTKTNAILADNILKLSSANVLLEENKAMLQDKADSLIAMADTTARKNDLLNSLNAKNTASILALISLGIIDKEDKAILAMYATRLYSESEGTVVDMNVYKALQESIKALDPEYQTLNVNFNGVKGLICSEENAVIIFETGHLAIIDPRKKGSQLHQRQVYDTKIKTAHFIDRKHVLVQNVKGINHVLTFDNGFGGQMKLSRLDNVSGKIESVVYDTLKRQLYVGTARGIIYRFNGLNGDSIQIPVITISHLQTQSKPVKDIVVQPDGKILFITSGELFSISNGIVKSEYTFPNQNANCMALGVKKQIYVGAADGTLFTFTENHLANRTSYKITRSGIKDIYISPNGILVAKLDNTSILMKWPQNKEFQSLLEPTGAESVFTGAFTSSNIFYGVVLNKDVGQTMKYWETDLVAMSKHLCELADNLPETGVFQYLEEYKSVLDNLKTHPCDEN